MRRLLGLAIVWFMAMSMSATIVSAQTGDGARPPATAGGVRIEIDSGGVIELDAADLETYRTEFADGQLQDIELHQPRPVVRGVHFRMVYATVIDGTTYYYGLGTFEDPATDTKRAGWVLGVETAAAAAAAETTGRYDFTAVLVDNQTGDHVSFRLLFDAAPPTCGAGGDTTPGVQQRTFTTSSGVERTYLLNMPSSYVDGTPSDVVFNFHGLGSNAAQQNVYAGFTPLAERDGVIQVAPDGLPIFGNTRGWSLATAGTNVDVDFVYELIDELHADYCLGDFFAAGMSMGGGMTSVLACRADSPFQAFGPVTLVLHNANCANAPARPIVEFHGTADGVVPIGPIPGIMQQWADHNDCAAGPIDQAIDATVTLHAWTGCAAPTSWYEVEGGGHAWPGALGGGGVSATEIIWDLFFATP
ncbi:MAG: hypothetical protein OEW42_15845 [Acidimicrobiia bacterium]|nr:hypothetical protein [Acidimicrobiia bacterium]